ncbi:unnamed protein product [Linum trigynum]|uniref:Uncharacterized protein n=1 Tax=Linum trigynum TaxID=586398 RepID=A0AAV2DF92_9ROSI
MANRNREVVFSPGSKGTGIHRHPHTALLRRVPLLSPRLLRLLHPQVCRRIDYIFDYDILDAWLVGSVQLEEMQPIQAPFRPGCRRECKKNEELEFRYGKETWINPYFV